MTANQLFYNYESSVIRDDAQIASFISNLVITTQLNCLGDYEQI